MFVWNGMVWIHRSFLNDSRGYPELVVRYITYIMFRFNGLDSSDWKQLGRIVPIKTERIQAQGEVYLAKT